MMRLINSIKKIGDNNKEPLTILVADRSAFFRMIMRNVLESRSNIKLVNTAATSRQLFDNLQENIPDVILLEKNMLSDYEAKELHQILLPEYCHLFYITDDIQSNLEGPRMTFIKPEEKNMSSYKRVINEMIAKIEIQENYINSSINYPENVLKKLSIAANVGKIVVIGASTGGIPAIEKIISNLPKSIEAAIIIAQHIPKAFSANLSRRLNGISNLPLYGAMPGMNILPGNIYIAPGNCNLVVKPLMGNRDKLFIELEEVSDGEYNSPNVDKLMQSVAQNFSGEILGILLSGFGKDGTEGFRSIKKAGGKTLVQDESTSAIYGMGKSAIDEGLADKILPLDLISSEIFQFSRRKYSQAKVFTA